MKSSTQNIVDIIRNQIFQENVKGLIKYLSKNSISLDYGEINISEIVIKLNEIIGFIDSEKGIAILDELSKGKRDSMYSYSSNTQSYIQSIYQSQNHLIMPLIEQVEAIYDILHIYIINPDLKKYSFELAEIKKLKGEYQKILVELEKLLSDKEVTQEFSDDIKKIRSELEELSSREAHIREIEQTIEQKKANIVKFSDDIDEYKTDITTGKTNLTTLTGEFRIVIDKYNSISSNVDRRSQALLNLVTEGSLGQHFSTKEVKIEADQYFKGFVLSIFVGILCLFFAFELIDKDVFQSMSDVSLLIIRFLFLLPFLFVGWMFYREYSFHRNLKEKYSFRSILALSLRSFSDIISNHTDVGTKQFIESTVNQIFESPLETKGGLSKKLSEQVIEKSLEKALSIGEKVVDKTMSN